MNSLTLVVLAIVFFAAAYRVYAKVICRIFGVDPQEKTPAHTRYDGVDYVPARSWFVLFGHHFSSIAGAGPVIGPVLAVMLWGWAPALLWVLLGSVFFGGVHDLGSLIVSVKERGVTIADSAARAVSGRGRILFLSFVLLALILVVTVFAVLCAKTLFSEPKVAVPSIGLIPLAMAFGYVLYYRRFNPALMTLLALACLSGFIFLGERFPVVSSYNSWLVVLFIYAYAASVLPVNILLQPRDYLAGFLLFGGVAIGLAGIFITRPALTLPAFTGWHSAQGELWPMLFVIVACGAISGFHSLVAGGTTSKQIDSQRHCARIGYGAMLAEGLVAVMAIIAAAIIFKPQDDLAGALRQLTPIGIYADGYAAFTLPILGRYGAFAAITILNAFIFTTLDTATRISRYLFEELFGIKNRFVSTFVIVGVSAVLAYSNQWNRIWPVFGASNQLVAALALLVLSSWLLARGKNALYTLIPAVFMLATTVAALGILCVQSMRAGERVLVAGCSILIVLAVFMVLETAAVIKKLRALHAG